MRDDLRSWNGDESHRKDDLRTWVVWGEGRLPDMPAAEHDEEIASGIARGADDEWAALNRRWVTVIEAREDDVDTLVRENDELRGYAPYLMPGKNEEMPQRYMRGTLRSDVGPRRKVDQPRPS